MNRKFFVLATLLTLLALLLSMPGTLAQEPEPPLPPKEIPGEPFPPFGGPIRTPDGLWVMPGGTRPPLEAADIRPLDTGGPDDFGYVWDDSVPFSWVDATSGTNTGLTGERQQVGPIALPFSFKYYENTYNQIYISTNGTLGFSGELTQDSQEWVFPKPSLPNNVIAPYWAPEDASTGGVYYTSGGTAPNRWWVVEWHQVRDYEADSRLTFEAVLFENGDIEFRYQTINYGTGGSWWSYGVGIEDSAGLDGLEYTGYPKDNLAVHFTRPVPSARVRVHPLYHGCFTHAGAVETFQVTIRNTGELGSDTYDLFVSSPWSVGLYAADGTTPLPDTDSDGTVDTGSLAQGGSATVVVKVTTPGIANVGDDNTAAVTACSSLDTGKSKTVSLQTGVPAPFAQVFRDDADGAMSLYLVHPGAPSLKKVTSDYYYGYDMAVAEMPDSFAYLWTKSRSVDSVYVREIEYTLLDRYGNTVRGVSRLTDHSGATMHTYDYDPAVAVAPNGRIGVLWYNYLYDYGTGTSRNLYNIYFAVLDASGNVVVPPTNLTNNNDWYQWDPPTYGVPEFHDARIAATGDNRFILAWRRYSRESEGSLSDIYYAVRDTNGGAVKAVTKFTSGAPGGNRYSDPALAALSGNRALLAYDGPSGISYAVLDSGGNTVKAETPTGGYGWGPDVVQLSDGKVVVAWSRNIEFAVLGSTTYDVVAGPTALSNPAAVTGDAYVSVAADNAGHAILTWMDSDWSYRPNLYYALVDGNGNVLTDPMIFRTSQATDLRIDTSYEGYGNTHFSWDTTPPTNPTILISPSHITGTWSNDDTIDVTWSGAADAESGVDGYSVLWDNAPTTVPDATKDLEESVQNATSDPLADGDWYFHVRTVDNAGNWANNAAHIGPFRIDTTAPRSSAQSPEYAVGPFPVTWSGSDTGSGIVSYDVQVRDGAGGTWTEWLADTTATSATYTAGVTGHTYYFRSVAHDTVGNVETDLPAGGDTHTIIAAYKAEGQVTNNRHQPVFNATIMAYPAALNIATTDGAGDYVLYFGGSGTYMLMASRSGFGVLPPRYEVTVNSDLSSMDFVLPPENEAVTNGGWETGNLSGWNSGPGVTPTVEMTATHTGRYGVRLDATGGALGFWPYITQSVSIPVTWSQPTLSFMYCVIQGSPGDALLATVSGDNEVITHSVALTPDEWTHTWHDLSAFSGQTVTLSFGFKEQTGAQQVYLDEISLGEARPGVFPVYLPLVMRRY